MSEPKRIQLHDHVDGNSGGKLAASASATGAAASSSSGGSSSGGSGITLQEDGVDVANGLVAISVNHGLDATAAGGIAVDETELTYGGTGDMTAEAIASTVSAGASGKPSDAAHRHAMPSAGTPSGGYGSAAAGSAATVLRSDAVLPKPADTEISLVDETTQNATTGRHGFLKKLDNSATNFMNGQGNWAAPGVSSAGLNAGTSNPGSPATSDLFFRTDKGLIIYYDGTRWLTTTLFHATMAVAEGLLPFTATTAFGRITTKDTTGFDLWLVSFETTTFVTGTTNSTNFWTVDITKYTAGNVGTLIVSFDTKTDTGNNWTAKQTAIGASLAVGTHLETQVTCTKTLSPSSIYIGATLSYRLVVV